MSFPLLDVDTHSKVDLTVRGISRKDLPLRWEDQVSWLASREGEIWVVFDDPAKDIRKAFAQAVHPFRHVPSLRLRLDPPEGKEREALEGVILGLYPLRFPPVEGERYIFLSRDIPGLEDVKARMQGVYTARDLASWPANGLSPSDFASRVQKYFASLPITVQIWDTRKLRQEGLEGILAVGRGSARPPCLLRLSYHPQEARFSANLVGKGVVFDTGGINIKITRQNEMVAMRQDKTGAAVVVGIVEAVARMNLPVHLEAAIPLVENMPSGDATRPGDIIRMHNGTYVEITNTDAEGRLILADALSLIQEENPQKPMVDFATLTGAAVVALGRSRAPVFSNNQELQEALIQAGERVGEPLWPLPVGGEYRELLRSSLAEIVNSAEQREAGAIVGATFLSYFVHEETPWAHIDIAGTGIRDGVSTAFGVRLMIDMLESQV